MSPGIVGLNTDYFIVAGSRTSASATNPP